MKRHFGLGPAIFFKRPKAAKRLAPFESEVANKSLLFRRRSYFILKDLLGRNIHAFITACWTLPIISIA